MPFFENAQHFSIHGAEMNDVKGNYTRNETRSAADNADSNNQYFASTVAMRNTESRTAAIGGGHNNSMAFGSNRMMVGATVTGLTPDVAKLLQNLQFQNISGMTTQTSTYAPASRSETPPSAVSKSLAFLAGIPADLWTPEMVAALSQFVTSIELATQGKRKH